MNPELFELTLEGDVFNGKTTHQQQKHAHKDCLVCVRLHAHTHVKQALLYVRANVKNTFSSPRPALCFCVEEMDGGVDKMVC